MLNPMRRQLKLVATGDAIITQRLSMFTEPAFQRMVDLIRSADVRFTNLELTLHNFEGHPAVESGGTWLAADPVMLEELKWLGFNLYAWANNHAMDWSDGGMIATLRNLDLAGVVHAGVGRSLADAQRPAYLDLEQGRVALISMTASFAAFARAGHSRQDCVGRPGINPLRYDTTLEVDADSLATLRRIVQALDLDAGEKLTAKLGYGQPPEPDTVKMGNLQFKIGERTAVRTAPNKADAEGNLRSVRDARRQAEWVVVSIHAHEMKGSDLEQPAEFLPTFARQCIDAGADIVIGHGPHVLRGIEMYKGKPIFYSLGNFIFQNESVRQQPADWYQKLGLEPNATIADLFDERNGNGTRGFPSIADYWESIIPHVTWEAGEVREIRLYPISLGHGLPRSVRGRPVVADPELGRKIVERVDRLSAPLGTRVTWGAEGFGVVKL